MSKSILADALPDMIIGLLGVPVAFAIQEVAQQVLPDFQNFDLSQINQYMFGVFFILGIYALYSVGTLLIFEESINTRTGYLPWLIPFHILLAGVMASLVIVLGKYYSDGDTRITVSILVLVALTIGPMGSVILSGNSLLNYWKENRTITILALTTIYVLFVLVILVKDILY